MRRSLSLAFSPARQLIEPCDSVVTNVPNTINILYYAQEAAVCGKIDLAHHYFQVVCQYYYIQISSMVLILLSNLVLRIWSPSILRLQITGWPMQISMQVWASVRKLRNAYESFWLEAQIIQKRKFYDEIDSYVHALSCMSDPLFPRDKFVSVP